MKMIFFPHAFETRYHKKVFALSLVLKVKIFGTPKCPVPWIIFQGSVVNNMSRNFVASLRDNWHQQKTLFSNGDS